MGDGGYKLSRVADGARRLCLPLHSPKVLSPSIGRAISDGAKGMGKLLERTEYCAQRVNLMMVVWHIDPALDEPYMQHRLEQAAVENQSRRLRSSESRYAAQLRGEQEWNMADKDAVIG